MQIHKIPYLSLIATAILLCAGFGYQRPVSASGRGVSAEIDRHITVLKKGTPVERAAAAYWLGQKHSAAATAVDSLTELLGDATEVDASSYRHNSQGLKMKLGEEAAAALVQIGHASIEPLIHVLKTSPEPEARKNAAWALGILHEQGASNGVVSASVLGA